MCSDLTTKIRSYTWNDHSQWYGSWDEEGQTWQKSQQAKTCVQVFITILWYVSQTG